MQGVERLCEEEVQGAEELGCEGDTGNGKTRM